MREKYEDLVRRESTIVWAEILLEAGESLDSQGIEEEDKQTSIRVFTNILEHEPKWKTHPMSVWNRVRRRIHKLQGEEISEAKSFNPDTQEWEL